MSAVPNPSGRQFRALWAALLLVAVTATALWNPAFAQQDFDPFDHEYEYVQSDEAGDVYPSAASWGDITMLSMTTLDDGSIVLRMDLDDLSLATGDTTYVPAFTVNDADYEAGVRVVWAAGEPTVSSSHGWDGEEGTIGTPEVAMAQDAILVTIAPDEIQGLDEGHVFTDIHVQVGIIVGAIGSTSFHDTLSPSQTPVDFTYGQNEQIQESAKGIVYKDVEDSRLQIEESFPEPTNRTIHYNWTASWENVTLRLGPTDGSMGGIEASMADGTGRPLLNTNFTRGPETHIFERMTPGEWSLNVTFRSFQGGFTIVTEEYVPDEGESMDPEETEPESTPEVEGQEELPGLTGVWILVFVLATAFLRRRSL